MAPNVTSLAPLHGASRLWLPPLRLAGCVRAVLLRDTRGQVPDDTTYATYWPASPYCSLHLLFSGDGEWLATPGFVPPSGGYRFRACMLSGPFKGPTHMHARGPAHGLIVMFMLDASRRSPASRPRPCRTAATTPATGCRPTGRRC